MDKFLIRNDGICTSRECSGNTEKYNANVQKQKKRKICASWLDDFHQWLIKSVSGSGEEELFCKICNSVLKVSSGRADLLSHSATKKHKERAQGLLQNQSTITEKFQNTTNEIKKAHKLELQLSAFIAEHNLPFSCVDHLSLFIKTALVDSNIASKISCGRTKTTCLVKNVLGRTQFEYICSLLREHKFSLCIDESTDISNQKSLCLVIRLCLNFCIKDFFFALILVENCDAKSIYKCIVEYFEKHNICYKNMIGFAADGAPNMTGKNLSVAKLFKDDIPNLLILKCICHSLALCSSYACLKLPSSIESLVRNVYNYISNSPQRSAQFAKVSMLLEYKPKKMLHPAQTRWLSLELVVNRILELYEPLKIFFSFAINVDHIDSASAIFDNLNDLHELYLCFLKYILRVINNVNTIFQSKNSQIQKMYTEMQRLYMTILDNFIKPQYLHMEHIYELVFEDTSKFLENESIYLGIYVQERLAKCKLSEVVVREFIINCTSFYVELCKQIQKRFDFKNSVLKDLSFMEPRNIVKKEMCSLQNLISNFPNLIAEKDKQILDNEYRELRHIKFEEYFDNIEEVTAEKFWETIAKIKRGDSSQAFPLLSKFVSNLMCLPNSSANVERIFSKVNLNKTKYRNRLDYTTLEGILLTQDYLLLNNCSCYNLTIENDILKNYKPSQYYT